MNFSTLQTDLSQILGLDTADSTQLANMKRWINTVYKDLQTRYRWSWLITDGKLQTILTYETGTVTVTNASRTVTGDGTAFTSAMVGRYFNVKDNSDWYKIIAVGSTTSLTLDKPYLRETASSKTYYIWNKIYKLNTDCQDLLDVYSDDSVTSLKCLSIKDFSARYNEYGQGTPTAYIETEVDKAITTYSTGTCSGTVSTKVITGSGTLWLDNLSPGDEFTVGSYTYNVQSVDSDTQITITGYLSAAITSSTAYSAARTNLKTIQLNYTPSTYAKNLTYKYIKKIYDLVNNSDMPDMPDRWHHVISIGAQVLAYKSLDDSREAQALQIYEGKIKQMIREDTSKANQPSTWTRC